jgi:hypothetical protein
MTEEEFVEIIKDDDIETNISGPCNACAGLDIIRKYLPKQGIEGAEHDVIYSAMISEIVEAGITKEDAIKLCSLNWMIDEHSGEGLACFV